MSTVTEHYLELQQQARARLGDVPAKIAMVAWNPRANGIEIAPPFADGRIMVVPAPDEDDYCRKLALSDTDGACYTHWEEMSTRDRVDALLVLAIEICVHGGMDMKDVHEALSVIPEYRARISKACGRKAL